MSKLFPTIILTTLISFSLATQAQPTATPIGEAGSASSLDSAFGVDVGPDGLLYVAVALRNQILALNPHTGRVVKQFGPEQGVDGPDDLEVGDDGTLYWTSPVLGTVSLLKPDGTFRTQIIAPGINPITISEDGRIFAAAAFTDSGLFELDAELLMPPRTVIADITGLNGFDVGPDGLLYSPDTNRGNVVKINVDTGVAEDVVPPGTFNFPGAVSFDNRQVLHVMEAARGEVFRLDTNNGARRKVFDIRGNIDNIAFDNSNSLYVSTLGDGQIFKRFRWGFTLPLNRGGIVSPTGLAVNEFGMVYAADGFSLKSLAPGFPIPLQTNYTTFSEGLTRPLSADAKGRLALVTSIIGGGLVQIVDTFSGDVIDQRPEFFIPSNAVFHGEDIAVARLLGGDVVRGDTGEPLISGLFLPLGLASQGDNLFVGDFASGLVWRVGADGIPQIVAAGLLGPEGIAVTGQWLIVAETLADRISAINLATGQQTVLINIDLGDTVPTGVPPYGALNGVAIDERRQLLYVASDITNQVLAYRLNLPQ